MSYPGNTSLAQDVQERISNTFQQTLDLVTENRDQEAVVGCEFILRMDPDFQPAKTLVARLKSGQRPVVLDDLRTSPAAAGDLGSLDDLDDLDELSDLGDLGDLDDLGFEDEPAAEAPSAIAAGPPAAASPSSPPSPPSAPAAASGLATVVQDLLAKRNLDQILQIAETQKQVIAGDPQVQGLIDRARALAESDAYVQTFLKLAAEAREAGRIEEIEKQLEKARALDPEHPQVLAFAAAPPAPETADDVLTLDDAADPLEGVTLGPDGAAADEDLLALQQQSLSLDGAEAPPEQVASDLARDPRQTNPMDAVTIDDDAGDAIPAVAPPVEEPPAMEAPPVETPPAEAPAGAPRAEASFEDLGADLFDDDDAAAAPLDDGDDAVAEFEAELFDDEAEASETAEPRGFGMEFELDGTTFDDGGAPAAEEAAEGGDRVVQLLAEGQEAFDRGEFQSAIDVWSRIFLIEIDNPQASQRIEEARNKKAEIERQAEELFHEAAGQIERMSLDEAKNTLGEVLSLVPGHTLARKYLDKLEAGQVPTVTTTTEVEAPSAEAEDDDLDSLLVEPEDSPSLEAAVERDRVVVVKKTDMRIVALGAVVLVAVLGGGGFLMLKWDDLFPNQQPPTTMAQQPRKVDPIERATKMHQSDQTENAILLLERIQPQDPVYEDAQALIAQWKALVESPEPVDTGPSEQQLARYNLLLGAGREAHGQRRFLRARRYFEMAGKILPLGADEQTLVKDCDDRLRPLEEEIKMFNEGQYAAIIPDLWRKRETDADNLDIQRLLVDSYDNLALTDLQRNKTGQAARKMREALEIQPDNLELERLHLFAQTYSQRPPDLLYRIFVKYLPSRG